jgi:hypothetical protein
MCGGVEVYILAFLTSTVDGNERSASIPATLGPRKQPVWMSWGKITLLLFCDYAVCSSLRNEECNLGTSFFCVYEVNVDYKV